MSNIFSIGVTIVTKIALIVCIFAPMMYFAFQMAKEGAHILNNLEPEPESEPDKTGDDLIDEINKLETESKETRRESDKAYGIFFMFMGIFVIIAIFVPIIMIIKM